MDPVPADILMRSFDFYIDTAREHIRKADKDRFLAKVFYAEDRSGRFIITPPLISLEMNDYGNHFCGFYMTRTGKIWIEEFREYQTVFRPYRPKRDRELVFKSLSDKFSAPLYRPRNELLGFFGILCIFTFFHQKEKIDKYGNGYTTFYPDMPYELYDIKKNIETYVKNRIIIYK